MTSASDGAGAPRHDLEDHAVSPLAKQ
jgi:hypothetical protein